MSDDRPIAYVPVKDGNVAVHRSGSAKEIERLREALADIWVECEEAPIGPADITIVAIQRIARAALSSQNRGENEQ